ncbi:MAG: substrate-binding domain-containing protein, partial [Hominilimicola sp.]
IISAAHENGINIPNDMQITGFDDSLSSAYFIPSVTTVSQNIDKLAKRCFSMLMDLINKKSAVSSIIEQNIIARNSAKINI